MLFRSESIADSRESSSESLSASISVSFSLRAISNSWRASSIFVKISFHPSTRAARRDFSFRTVLADSRSFQKSGAFTFWSSSAISFSFLSRSKKTPHSLYSRHQCAETLLDFFRCPFHPVIFTPMHRTCCRIFFSLHRWI